MEVKRLGDPAEFLDKTQPLLLADEARHNLMLGIAGGLRDHPGLYHEFRGWVVEAHDGVAGAAIQTPPFNLVLARPSSDGVIETLVGALRAEDVELSGVTGAVPEAGRFGERWTHGEKLVLRARMRQRIYQLTKVRPVRGVPGTARPATHADDRCSSTGSGHSRTRASRMPIRRQPFVMSTPGSSTAREALP